MMLILSMEPVERVNIFFKSYKNEKYPKRGAEIST